MTFSTSETPGRLFAFVLVATGVFVLRRTQPDTPRKFKVPIYPVITVACAMICIYLMLSLPLITWIRFFLWMGIGLVIYFVYSRKHSNLRSR